MKKKLFLSSISIILASTLFTGCDESTSSCKFDIQKSLDNKEYQKTVDLLDNQCQLVLSNKDMQTNYGFAYLGLAGLDMYSVLANLVNPDNKNSSGFGGFISSINDKSNDQSLSYLKQATSHFNKTKDNLDCNDINLNYAYKDICFYKGITETLKASLTFNYLTDDLDSFVNGDNTNPDDMAASACAMEYALKGSCSNTDILSVTELPAITFIPNNKTYTPLNINIKGVVYQHLISKTAIPNTSILVKDSCDLNFITCNTIGTNCYACPVDKSNSKEELSSIDLLVDSLNGGLDTIGSLTDDPEVNSSIEDFKSEISADGRVITNQDILDYLNKKEIK